MLRFLMALLASAMVVPVRRVRRGPRCPGWTPSQEVVIDAMERNGRASMRVEPAVARRRLESLSAPSAALKRVTYEEVDVDGIPGVWLTPGEVTPGSTLLYFHGGGYVFCSVRTHRDLIARLSIACGRRALAVDYRLAPEHPFPAAVDDCLAAYRWLLDSGTDAADIVLCGDSAGGGLALAVILQSREHNLPLPAGAVLLSPWVDLASTCDSVTDNAAYDWGDLDYLQYFARLYLGDSDATHPLASPLYADLDGFPPLLVQVGDAELLFDEARTLAARAQESGVDVDLQVYPNMVHSFQSMASVFPTGEEAIAAIGAWTTDLAGPSQQRET